MNNEQIAREAAENIAGELSHANVQPLWIQAIILAAIEKAREAEIKKFLPMVKAEIAAKPQATDDTAVNAALAAANRKIQQCSQDNVSLQSELGEKGQQLAAVEQLADERPQKLPCGHLRQFLTRGNVFPQICMACRAAEFEKQLAAEREEREIVERSRESWKRQCAEALQQLDAEREISKEWFDKWGETNSQLLQAQAAIARIRDEAVTLVDARKYPNSVLHIESPQRIKDIANSVDLSALDKHDAELIAKHNLAWETAIMADDAEVRKPLVDALEEIRNANGRMTYSEIVQRAIDALAKVKEGK